MAVNIGPKIGIDGEAEYRKQINNIIQDTKTLKSEYEKVSSSVDNNTASFKQNKEMHRILSEEINTQKDRIEKLSHMVDESTKAFGDADPKTQKWKQALYDANTELNKMESELDGLPSQVELLGDKFQSAGDKIKDIGGKIEGIGRSLSPISAAAAGVLGGSAKSAIDFESAMVGVMKTNDELVDSNGNVLVSYDDLANSIKQMSTETASTKGEIAGIMESAGQLGVGTEYLTDFTKNIIMLKDSTNLSAEEGAQALARFSNITSMSLNDTDRLGSTIVALGNNFATTEADIVAMATRLAGAGSQIGLSQSEIMGFATALSSVGIEAEMGGSAFSKAMVKMQVAAETGFEPVLALEKQTGLSLRDMELMSTNDTKSFKELAQSLGMTTTELKATITAGNNLNDFAKVAQMSTDDFVELYRSDAPAALQAFIHGLGDTDTAGESTIAMLQDMGFTEVRLRDTLTRLANSGDLVTDAVNMGNDAWDKNTALVDEATKRYESHEAKISQAKESLTNVGIEIGERLLPYVEKGIGLLDKAIAAWDQLSPETQDMIVQAVGITAALAPVLIVGGKLITGIGSIVSGIGMLASPVGIAVVAIGALVAIGVTLYKNWDEICAWAGKLKDTVVTHLTAMKDGAKIAWDNMKTNASETWNNIKTGASEKWNTIKTTVSTHANAIKDGAKIAWDNMVTNTKNKFEEIKKNITQPFKDAWETVKSKIEEIWNKIKNLGQDIANFHIQFPDIKMPHFNVEWQSYGKFSLPKLSVDWYAKAMRDGIRMTSPTIFGVGKNGLMGGGEVGNEWVIGESSLMNMIRQAVSSASNQNNVNVGDTTIIINADGQDVEEIATRVDEILTSRMQSLEAVWA